MSDVMFVHIYVFIHFSSFFSNGRDGLRALVVLLARSEGEFRIRNPTGRDQRAKWNIDWEKL